LNHADHETLSAGYSFHRLAEARLRIVTNRPLNEYPEAPADLEKLARRMGLASAAFFRDELAAHASRVREAFNRLL
jgi:glutamate-ammonia-ligase adenylyltransferase